MVITPADKQTANMWRGLIIDGSFGMHVCVSATIYAVYPFCRILCPWNK